MNKLTPREPTAQMLWSGASALLDESKNDLDATAKEIAAAWRAMHDAAPSGWQPIETAPKNEVVLLCDTHGNRWSDLADGANGCGFPATHWVPLPAPPKEEA